MAKIAVERPVLERDGFAPPAVASISASAGP
jgi:hypothetical protein